MKIIHTSDWHLGKNLEAASRIDEQQMFIDDFVKVVEQKNIDMVIIAGDIYDNSNPPAAAEKMFYKAIKDISNKGKRIVLIISGNHDNPDRLAAASPLAYEQGIIIVPKPKSVASVGKCGNHKILDAGEGYLEIEINNEKAVIITMPYPSEKRLDEIIYETHDDKEMQKAYSTKLGEIFNNLSRKYRKDTINLAVSHLYVIGGEKSESERNIELGGSYAVFTKDLPLKAQYIALGHLHKTQQITKDGSRIIYSGSPLQYSKSEINYKKCYYEVDIEAGKEPITRKIEIKNYKPIEVWKCSSIEDAIETCEKNKERDVWVYLEVKTDTYIEAEDIKIMKSLKKDILEIKPIIVTEEDVEEKYFDYKEKKIEELFEEFYLEKRGVGPKKELMELFSSIVEEGDEE